MLSRRRHKLTFISAVAFCAVGLGYALAGLYLAYSSWAFAFDARETEGIVLRLVPTGKRESVVPVVRYEVDGNRFEFQSQLAAGPQAYRKGGKVTVLYHADDPAHGHIKCLTHQWLYPGVLAAGGVVFILIGVGVGILHMQRSRASEAQVV